MSKHYGDIPCVNLNGVTHITTSSSKCACGQEWMYGHKNRGGKYKNIIWRTLNAVNCPECIKKYEKTMQRKRNTMRIDLPFCNFQYCRYHFDGNCTKQSRYETCDFRETNEELEKKNEEIKTLANETREKFAERLKVNLEYDYCSYSQDLITLINDTVKELEEK